MKIFRILIIALFMLLTVACGLSTAYAAIPHLINYQGRLTDKGGTPVNSTCTLTFTIYDDKTAGAPLWQGTYKNVFVSKGIFNILLGDVSDTGYNFEKLAFDKPYWLEIKVGEDVMGPRQQVISVGYAMRAEAADKAKDSDTVSGIGASVAPTPNKLLPLDDKAKLPLSALKVYDSGWFALNTNTESNRTKLLTHNLGTSVFIPLVYCSANSDGSNAYLQPLTGVKTNPDGNDLAYGMSFEGITPSQVRVRIGNQYNGIYVGSDGENKMIAFGSDPGGPSTAYWRVILIAIG